MMCWVNGWRFTMFFQIKFKQLLFKLSTLTYRKSVFKWQQIANISQSITHKMVAKTSWHRCGTKLHHCHSMYSQINMMRHRNSTTSCITLKFIPEKWKSLHLSCRTDFQTDWKCRREYWFLVSLRRSCEWPNPTTNHRVKRTKHKAVVYTPIFTRLSCGIHS